MIRTYQFQKIEKSINNSQVELNIQENTRTINEIQGKSGKIGKYPNTGITGRLGGSDESKLLHHTIDLISNF